MPSRDAASEGIMSDDESSDTERGTLLPVPSATSSAAATPALSRVSSAKASHRWRLPLLCIIATACMIGALFAARAMRRYANFRADRTALGAEIEGRRKLNAAMVAAHAVAAAKRMNVISKDSTYAIVGMFGYEDGRSPSCTELAVMENHRRYAAMHGYAYYKSIDEIVRNPDIDFLSDVFFYKERLVREKLRQGHEWVLYLDYDAIFVDFSVRLEDVVRRFAPKPAKAKAKAQAALKTSTTPNSALLPPRPSLLFSGDTCIINAGVILVRKSEWSETMLSETITFGREYEFDRANAIGMTGDNAALAMMLGGCTPASTQAERIACYDRVNLGWTDKEITRRIRGGDAEMLDRFVGPAMRPHVQLLSQAEFQAYFLRDAKFMLHYPSSGDWRFDPAQQLLPPYLKRAPNNKREAMRVVLQAVTCGERWAECFPVGPTRERCEKYDWIL